MDKQEKKKHLSEQDTNENGDVFILHHCTNFPLLFCENKEKSGLYFHDKISTKTFLH
jgi:hypothetical protein